jgi:hypothetical protein
MEDELGSAGRGKTVVVAELVFKVGEVAVEEVGGVGDLKGGKAQAGEQPREVVLEAEEGAAKAGVAVAGAVGMRGGFTLVKEGFPLG